MVTFGPLSTLCVISDVSSNWLPFNAYNCFLHDGLMDESELTGDSWDYSRRSTSIENDIHQDNNYFTLALYVCFAVPVPSSYDDDGAC